MPGRLIVAIAAAAITVALPAPSGAAAATEVGDDCAANLEMGNFVNVPETKAGARARCR